jgi:hypothetical protein
MQQDILEGEPVSQAVALALRPIDELALKAKQDEAARGLAVLRDMPCESADHEQAFADFLTACRAQIDALETDRKNHTNPLHTEKTRIDKLYKPVRDKWQEVEQLIRNKLQGAAQKRLDAEQAAKRLAAEAASVGDVARVQTALANIPAVVGVSGISHGSEWAYRVTNVNELPEAWRKTVINDEVAEAYCKTYQHHDFMPEVPGVVFERRAKVRAR